MCVWQTLKNESVCRRYIEIKKQAQTANFVLNTFDVTTRFRTTYFDVKLAKTWL